MTDYYALLCDPDFNWANDPDSPFRLTGIRSQLYIKCNLRHYKRESNQKLKKPVVERPILVIGRKRWHGKLIASSGPNRLSAKQKFNQQMQHMVERWRLFAEEMGCPHLQPYLLVADDSLKPLFHSPTH